MQKSRCTKMQKIISSLLCCFLIWFSINSLAENMTLCFYDIDSTQILTENRFHHIIESLKLTNADIVILAGIRNEEELKKIKKNQKKFIFSQIVKGHDKNSHIALLSNCKPESFQKLTSLEYVIKNDIKLPVQRGFIYATIKQNGYLLHVLAADLKNRDKHLDYNQTDMRRYEARLLRHLATDIIKKDKLANIIILANLNDTCGKSPVKEIYNRRFGIEKRLFDLRPLDKIQVSWTHYSKTSDEYERIDYAIVSSPLIPEINIEKTKIIDYQYWQQTSSHRPLIVSIEIKDKPLWTKEQIDTIFPHAIRTPGNIIIPPKIGEKRIRGSK